MLYWIDFLLILSIATIFAKAALPKPAWDCEDAKIEAKYFNEKCAINDDCFGSMICQKGQCSCKDDHVTEERFVGERAKQTICVPAPYLYAECKTICQKPFQCAPHQAGGNDSASQKKVCQCLPPFKLNHGQCYLECPANQQYRIETHSCTDKCKANQIRINDSCQSIAQLNEACNSDLQCQAAYSECTSNKCACMPGFLPKDGLCVPESVICPNGKTLSAQEKNLVECTVKSRPRAGVNPTPYGYMPREYYDDCSENHHCYLVGNTYKSENSTGYCCPKDVAQCPVGKPHPTGLCRSQMYEKEKECPWSSHYCHSSPSGVDSVCCPKRCDSNQLLMNGKCYEMVGLGDACSVDQQCSTSLTSCVNGICQCSKGSEETKDSVRPYCLVKCQPDEIMHDNQCFKPLSLGQPCKNQTWRCPKHAICNKHEVCSCPCPKFTLSQDVCAPMPQCPKPIRYHTYYRMAMAPEMAMDLKGYQPISEGDRNELLQNVTFCSVPTKEAPKVQVVAQCPENKYCAHYIDNLGICCTIPEYVCPSGKKPVSIKSCDPFNPLTCGVDQHCHRYLFTADSNSPVGTMCCIRSKEDEDSDF